MTIYVIY